MGVWHRVLRRLPLFVILLSTAACRARTVTPPGAVQAFGGMLLVDDFERAEPAWVAGVWPLFTDSSATRASIASEHATRGRQSLQLSFDGLNAPKAIYTLENDLDLSASQALAFDLFNAEGAADAVAIALRSGDAWQWQESPAVKLKPGANAVHIDLSAATFKSATTGWQHYAALSATSAVHQLALILYPATGGSVFVDRIMATGAPPLTVSTPADNAAITLSPLPKGAAQYQPLEFDITTRTQADNPFDPDQIAIDVRFKGSNGEQFVVPAFYFQDFRPGTREPVWPQAWKVRFTPPGEGQWTAQATLRAGNHSSVSEPITFDVAPAVARGFVRVSKDNARYLAFDNGEAFFPVGLNLGWGHEDPLQDYRRWFDALKRNGANATRIWMASWSFGIEWSDSGLGRYRLDRAWLLDQVMRMAEERGIYVILVLLNHGAFNKTVNPEWDANPYNAARGGPCLEPEAFMTDPRARQLFKQRLRYIAARWAYSPNLLAWEWWNEVDLTPLSDPNLLRPWLKEMTPYLRSVDPYRHLTSISYADSSDPRVIGQPELDTMQRHDYHTLDPRTMMPKAYAELTGYGTPPTPKPILYTEFGASPGGEQPGKFDPEGIQFHNGLWASTFSGYASAAMYWWWDNYIETNDYWYHLKGLSDFLRSEDLAALSPVQATQVSTVTVNAMVLGRTDRALVWLRDAQYTVEAQEWAYRQAVFFGGVKDADWHFTVREQRDTSVTLLGMAAGTYRVRWFDTRSGDLMAEATMRPNNGSLVIAAPPFTRDIAAQVRRISA